MVTSFNEIGVKINLDNIRESSDLIGYSENEDSEAVWHWYVSSVAEFPKRRLSDNQIKNVYKGLSYKKRVEKERERDQKINEMKTLKIFFDLTFLIWFLSSIIIAFLGWQNFWIGAIAFIYSVYQSLRRWLKLKGYKSKKEKDEVEKQNKMKHYYYHCEKNPKGFEKLRTANFEKEERESIRIQKEKLEEVASYNSNVD